VPFFRLRRLKGIVSGGFQPRRFGIGRIDRQRLVEKGDHLLETPGGLGLVGTVEEIVELLFVLVLFSLGQQFFLRFLLPGNRLLVVRQPVRERQYIH